MSRLRMVATTMMPPAQRLRPRTGRPRLPQLPSQHTLLIISNNSNRGNSNSSHRRDTRPRRSRQDRVSTNGSRVAMSPRGSLSNRSRIHLREITATPQRPRKLRRRLPRLLPRLRHIGRRAQISPTRRVQHQANARQGVASHTARGRSSTPHSLLRLFALQTTTTLRRADSPNTKTWSARLATARPTLPMARYMRLPRPLRGPTASTMDGGQHHTHTPVRPRTRALDLSSCTSLMSPILS